MIIIATQQEMTRAVVQDEEGMRRSQSEASLDTAGRDRLV